ncbi:MAG: prepilin-type N-terminal cleavage/methylation domain-containing protein [Rhodanobacteraceae bacterium]
MTAPSFHNPIPARQRGFSLIEVIAAFLIFAVGFGVLLQILTSSLRVAHRSQDYTQATLWAESKLDTVGVGEPLKDGSEQGSFDDKYRWDMTVQKIQPPDVAGGVDENLPIDLYQVSLTVAWGAPGREHSTRFETIRAVDSNQDQLRQMGRQRR